MARSKKKKSPELDQGFPYFQPIIDLANHDIYGYEVLARSVDPNSGKVKSLGPLFEALKKENDPERLTALDFSIQEQAIDYISKSSGNEVLFLNIMPRFLSFYSDRIDFNPLELKFVQLIHDSGLSPEQFVLEITEDEFAGDIMRLTAIVQALKAHGFKIAVDDLGAGMSGLTRLAYMQPDIIKVDLNLLRQSLSHQGFHQLLLGISFISHRLGSDLLFEGVEVEEEMAAALQVGGRFLQGFLFSEAREKFQKPETFTELVQSTMEEYSTYRIAELVQKKQVTTSVLDDFHKLVDQVHVSSGDVNNKMRELLAQAPQAIRKAVLYDFLGSQKSSMFIRNKTRWLAGTGDKDRKNIIWRPYFQQAIANYRHSNQKYYVSEPFQDNLSGLLRITVCMIVEERFVMLIDLDWRS